MKKLPLVVVEWLDSTHDSKWAKECTDLGTECMKCMTVGWKLKTTQKHIVLTALRSYDGFCANREMIPRGCITSIRVIE